MKIQAYKNSAVVTVSINVQGTTVTASVREGRRVLCTVEGRESFVRRTLCRLGLPLAEPRCHSVYELVEVVGALHQTGRSARHGTLVGEEPSG